jgi:hypothetical protein
MSPNDRKVLEAALKLPLKRRAALIARLLESVDLAPDGESPEAVERAWAREAERRIDDVEAGRARVLSNAETWRRVRRAIKNKA